MMPFKFPLPGEKALVMGIINLSPDSFYGESCCKTVEQALSTAERMLEEGADILDLGGRPIFFFPEGGDVEEVEATASCDVDCFLGLPPKTGLSRGLSRLDPGRLLVGVDLALSLPSPDLASLPENEM